MRVLEAERGLDLARDAAFVAGHSLGEYSALAAAGAFSIADTARLLRIRGEAMQEAVPVGRRRDGGAARARMSRRRARSPREAAQGEVCDVANDNGGGQVVVSGDKAAVERAIAHRAGARRQARHDADRLGALPLRPDGAGRRRDARGPRRRWRCSAPVVPLVANVTAAPVTRPGRDPRRRSSRQVTGTVRWRESVAAMAAAGVDSFVEVGAGKVLTGLVKRIAPGAPRASARRHARRRRRVPGLCAEPHVADARTAPCSI